MHRTYALRMHTIICLYPFSRDVGNLYQPSALSVEHLTPQMLLRGQEHGQRWERPVSHLSRAYLTLLDFAAFSLRS